MTRTGRLAKFCLSKPVSVRFCREIDRLQRENKLLERQFVEIQAKSEELAAEMLQLSEQVVRLDEGQRERDATVSVKIKNKMSKKNG
jgi:predicted  nucleic acid-binding Zn-ribbon protein